MHKPQEAATLPRGCSLTNHEMKKPNTDTSGEVVGGRRRRVFFVVATGFHPITVSLRWTKVGMRTPGLRYDPKHRGLSDARTKGGVGRKRGGCTAWGGRLPSGS